jgi:hypothetical protein
MDRDLSNFDPHAAPPKTAAFKEMVQVSKGDLHIQVEEMIPEDLYIVELGAMRDIIQAMSDRPVRGLAQRLPGILMQMGFRKENNPDDAQQGRWNRYDQHGKRHRLTLYVRPMGLEQRRGLVQLYMDDPARFTAKIIAGGSGELPED